MSLADLRNTSIETREPQVSQAGVIGEESTVAVGAALNSHDEFSPLKEVILGDPIGARIPRILDESAWLNLYGDLPADERRNVRTGPFSDRVIEESAEDLDAIAEVLRAAGVVVHRPTIQNHETAFGTPNWSSDGFYSYCPRDLTLVVGDTLIETPSPMRARYFETFPLRDVFTAYFEAGARWIAAPKPRLLDTLYLCGPDGRIRLGNTEPAFEAANVLRCGKDLFYQVSVSGNELGRRWLESALELLGEYRLHPLRGIYEYTHIDSTIAILRPGLVLLNPERITPQTIPENFRSWDVLWCPPMDTDETGPHALSSPWIGMNLLMIAPDLAMVDARQKELIAELERRHIDVIAHDIRHARALGGGMHCVTLDTVRDGGCEDYFG